MISWEELSHKKSDCVFRRKDNVQQAYNKHLLRIKKQNISIEQYILDNILTDNGQIIGQKISPNNFPYDLAKNISHYVYWFRQDYILPCEKAREICAEVFNVDLSDIILFENKQHRKSVKGVFHYQVFVRKEESSPKIYYYNHTMESNISPKVAA